MSDTTGQGRGKGRGGDSGATGILWRSGLAILLGVSLAGAVATVVHAADAPKAPATAAPPPSTNPPVVKYVPPPLPRGTGLRRQVGAGTRSDGAVQTVVTVMAPEKLGLAATDQPVLAWHLDTPSAAPAVVTVNQGFKTVFQCELAGPQPAGVRQVSLASPPAGSSGFRLQPGVAYEWAVRLKIPGDPAENPVSVGWIEFRPTTTAVPGTAADRPADERAVAWGAAGYWYDAVAALSVPEVRPALWPLLQQAGLKNVHPPKP